MHTSRLILISVAFTAVLSGCGGGGGGTSQNDTPQTPPPSVPVPPSTPTPPVATLDSISGTLATDVTFLALNTIAGGTIAAGTGGGVRLAGGGSAIDALSVGQLVFIPPDTTAGMPVGFSGTVVSRTTSSGTTVVDLMPAQVEDMFADLAWDLDTSRTGARVAAVIGPDGQLITHANAFARRQASFATYSGTLKSGDKGVEGELAVTYPFKSGNESLQLAVKINIKELKVRSVGTFDKVKFATNGGWLKLGAVVSGKVGGTVAVKAEKSLSIDLGSALYAAPIWKDLKMTIPRLYEWDGLGDGDKKGKIPVAGIILQPATPPQPFKGEGISRAKLDLLSVTSATIIWIYSDAKGSLSMEGEVGVKLDDVAIEAGMELQIDGSTPSLTPTGKMSTAKASLYGNGKAGYDQRLGASVAADVLLAGVRPMGVAVFAGIEAKGDFKGENANVELFPELGKVTGPWGCFEQTLWGGVQASAAMRFKAAKFPASALVSPQWRQKGPSKQVTFEMEWNSGKLATFHDAKMNKQFSAVCSGELSPEPMSIPTGGSKRQDVIDADSKLARSNLNQTPLPPTLEWTSSDTSLLRIVPSADGAMLTGLRDGAAVLTATDPRTKWKRSVVVQVGLTCYESVHIGTNGGGPTETKSTDCLTAQNHHALHFYRDHKILSDGKRAPISYGLTVIATDRHPGPRQRADWTVEYFTKSRDIFGVSNSLGGNYLQGTYTTKWQEIRTSPYDANYNQTYPEDVYYCSGGTGRHLRFTGPLMSTLADISGSQCPTLQSIRDINPLKLESNPYYIQDKAAGIAPTTWGY